MRSKPGYRRQGAFKILVQQVVNRVRGAMPIQNFPGPIIEQPLHPLDLRARHLREPRPLGKELAQQAILVLILPRSHGECGWAQ